MLIAIHIYYSYSSKKGRCRKDLHSLKKKRKSSLFPFSLKYIPSGPDLFLHTTNINMLPTLDLRGCHFKM